MTLSIKEFILKQNLSIPATLNLILFISRFNCNVFPYSWIFMQKLTVIIENKSCLFILEVLLNTKPFLIYFQSLKYAQFDKLEASYYKNSLNIYIILNSDFMVIYSKNKYLSIFVYKININNYL